MRTHLVKKFLSKLHSKLYVYHTRKAKKYLAKSIKAEKYLTAEKYDKADMEALKCAFESGKTNASIDMHSLYPSVMVTKNFPMG